MMSPDWLLSVKNLKKYFPIRKGILQRVVGQVRAVDNISFNIIKGETLGLVGESGCGKTTTGRAILRLIEPTAGKVLMKTKDHQEGTEKVVDVTHASGQGLKNLRRQMQIIFQDPFSSLNPRMSIGNIVGEPLLVYGMHKNSEWEDRVINLLKAVGLQPDHMKRYPHEFSGGQRQRIGIARALSLEPQFIIADEPVSALDVSIQAQVINLLEDLQDQFHLSYLFITHDLSIVKHLSDRVAVMYLGKIVELAEVEEFFRNPMHPYSKALLSAVLIPDPNFVANEIELTGEVPSSANPPSGCSFHPRCQFVKEICRNVAPQYREMEAGHFVSCHLIDH